MQELKANNKGRRHLQGPEPSKGEGFGLHLARLVNVTNSKTTGGIDVAELEAKIIADLGDMSAMVRFRSWITACSSSPPTCPCTRPRLSRTA